MAVFGFGALGDLFGRLTEEAIVAEMERRHVLPETGQTLLTDVQAKFGRQQDGWDDLAESTQADRVRQGYPADEPLLRTGTLRDAYTTWWDGPDLVVGVPPESDQAVIAEVQEFGNAHVPPRPVLGTTAAEDAHLLPERVWETIDEIAKPR